MAKIHLFGTCSGTEPMEGRHHLSFALETDGVYYFFDAGEGCAYAAHLSGVDVLQMRAIFISHPHMDHVGGLADLLWLVRKLHWRTGRLPENGKIGLFIPTPVTWEAVRTLLTVSDGSKMEPIRVEYRRVTDGEVYRDEHVTVTAYHNHHMQTEEGDGWKSFSYRIETEGKRLVFSGDVRSPEELIPVIGDGCDAFMMETGHHKVADVGAFAAGQPIGALYFIHHGREILGDPAAAREAVRSFACPARICDDGDILEL